VRQPAAPVDTARRAIAIERMSQPPTAVRSGESAIRTKPGDTTTGNWGITVT
jgi:hypothetical protein